MAHSPPPTSPQLPTPPTSESATPKRKRQRSVSEQQSPGDARQLLPRLDTTSNSPAPLAGSACGGVERVRSEEGAGAGSPRTVMSARLEGLVLEGGGGENESGQEEAAEESERPSLWESTMPNLDSTEQASPMKRRRKNEVLDVDAVDSADSTSSKSSVGRKKSPPLSSTSPDPLTWQDSEITGHLMTDPSDDGTGINGIGFKPTRAQDEARKLKRKQQVAAWRARETKEARSERWNRRVERERAVESSMAACDEANKVHGSDGRGVGNGCATSLPKKRAVRFA